MGQSGTESSRLRTGGHEIHVQLHRVAELTPVERSALQTLSAAVYPPEVAAAWSGRAIEWATPEWSVVVWGDRGEREAR